VPPTFAAAAGQGFRAALREAWLVPVGALVAGARRLAFWPAAAVLALIVVRAARAAAAETPFDPWAPLRGALVALGSTRVDALVMGLALAGLLVAMALRVAWVAGAVPTLGLALSGAPRAPRFAAGVAYRLPAVLAAAVVALLAEVAAIGFGATMALAALRVAGGITSGVGGAMLLAGACAFALTLSVAVPLVTGVVADVAVARAALRGEGPARAFAASARRLARRPATFAFGGLVVLAAGAIAPLSIQGLGSVMLGFARGVPPSLLAGPNLMLAALAVGVAAAVDVWWLATVASLAESGEPR
jgi:hypothetical protein